MSLRSSATRYARALLDVAIKESDPAKIEKDLAAFVALVASNAELKQVLTSPSVPNDVRRQIIENVARQSGAEAPVVKLLALLASRGRMEMVTELLNVYRQQLLAHRNIVPCVVTSAAPLAPEKVQALERQLSGVTGKQMQLDVSVDPSLIGGIVARIGSTVYDGSIRTQLQKMKQQLIENA
jgi:F-type H+-transporting ATPase subunit delta